VIPIRDTPAGATFAIRVHPPAKKPAITGVLGEIESAGWKVALAAPPAEGRDNQSVIEFLSAVFGVARAQVSIL
jgi:uncharacterized protein YggU (UPF0235/DUF167 family)